MKQEDGGHKVEVVVVSSWGVYNYNCSCGKNGGGYEALEYAKAAGKRHLKSSERSKHENK